ncbi:trinucleotide repeat-containing gene 18 protein-like [Neophocaena asiaeorientalis asiaeorientalis]|uniref:Trinucleotide repeat-containing gene 18 protein-like n=1 Tax=Neophocaena asiaeorientalis asiaeorientalis TaxID=1706337 RepID=A0A341CX17_NEOAA|nr:trinucleotide repeat-containing gene 18 protein-like [Neophocaena asiaeorientalis asiaeorientalis]
MDGRDFGPPRSVHGPPPPLLSGLAMDSHRVGAATAGRLPASGLPGALPPGKYMAGLNLHPHPGEAFLGSFVASGMGPSASSHGSPVPLPSDLSFRSPTPSNLPMVQLWAAHAHEGFSHLPSGLYPSYLHLNHLEPPSSGSPLLSQLGQPSIFDTQKDGFYLPAPGAPGALHSHAPSSRTPGGHSSGASTKGSSREGPAKDRMGRGGEPPPLFGKKDPRAREEAAGPRGEEAAAAAAAASKKAYLDPGGALPRAGATCARPGADLHAATHGPGEASAMQSLIKYSGSFAREAVAVRPGGCGKKSPFGGLGTMKPEPAPTAAPRAQARLPHPAGPAAAGGRQLKRDPERPESAKAFGREGSGAQGEAEVRHPPVGIAVAVARQKDSGSGRLVPGLADQERSLSLSNVKGHSRADEDCGDERARHREERLLGARLDRDQEKLLRESKELADLARLHPTSCAANGLNPNLMVTGGPALAGSGRWSADPAAHLATHPWLPRSGSTSMWLAGHPYGLGPPSLHQGMAPAFPPGLGGSLPSAYQFVRDPQSGQLVVIPSEHLPHFAELMERAAVPPLWPALYPPGRSSLHHAQQLQLFSQQHFLRQQEFLYLHQQAAQALELQRSAQLVERLKAQEQRAEMEEKVSKRSLDAAGKGGLGASGPGLLPRKPPGLAAGPAGTYGKAMSPPPSPRASPVAALKAKVIQKWLPLSGEIRCLANQVKCGAQA